MRHVSGPTALYLIYNKMNFNISYGTGAQIYDNSHIKRVEIGE